MLWRVRTTFVDRPGILAEIATACAGAGVNIVGMQVFATSPHVTDEFVIRAPDGWGDVDVADLFEGAGGSRVSVTRVGDEAMADATTRYLHGVHEILEQGRDVEAVLADLLQIEPPDVADYAGHDVLELTRHDGTSLRISRAVAFTPIEQARARAILALLPVTETASVPTIPSALHPVPIVRECTLADIESVASLHERCSVETLYHRYQVPLRMPMTTRLARRLVAPESGTSLLVQVGPDIVGHGLLELLDARWTFQLLIEDAWQGRGLGTLLVKQAAARAKGQGAERLTFVTAGGNDKLLRAVGNAGFVARVERHDGNVHITVPLAAVRSIAVG